VTHMYKIVQAVNMKTHPFPKFTCRLHFFANSLLGRIGTFPVIRGTVDIQNSPRLLGPELLTILAEYENTTSHGVSSKHSDISPARLIHGVCSLLKHPWPICGSGPETRLKSKAGKKRHQITPSLQSSTHIPTPKGPK